MTSDDQRPDGTDEQLVQRVLAAAGERPVLPNDLRQRWENTFRQELGAAREQRRRRIAKRWLPLAAGIAALALLTMQLRTPPAAGTFGIVVAASGFSEVGNRGSAESGAVLREGDRLRTGPAGYVTIDARGVQIRVAPNSVIETRPGVVWISDGQVYLDTDPLSDQVSNEVRVDVHTPFGRVVHTGTQFLVSVTLDELALAVREGAVELVTDWARFNYRATATSAPFVRVARNGEVDGTTVARHGGIWAWTETASPGLAVGGRSVHEALSWAARERGLRLTYHSPAARQRADALLSAPADHSMAASAVLELVDRVTYLNVEVAADGVIVVSESDHKAN